MDDYILDTNFGPVYWRCNNGHLNEVNVYRPAVVEDGTVTSGYFGSAFHKCSECDGASSVEQRTQMVEELTDIVKYSMAIDVANRIIAEYHELGNLYDWADKCLSDFKEEHRKYRSMANSHYFNNNNYFVAAEALAEVLMHAVSAFSDALYDLTVSVPMGKLELFVRAKEYAEDVVVAKRIFEKRTQDTFIKTTDDYIRCSECGWYDEGFHSKACSKRDNVGLKNLAVGVA